jgi:hypothetical protein
MDHRDDPDSYPAPLLKPQILRSHPSGHDSIRAGNPSLDLKAPKRPVERSRKPLLDPPNLQA